MLILLSLIACLCKKSIKNYLFETLQSVSKNVLKDCAICSFQDRPDILEIFKVFLLEFNIQSQPLKYYVKREKKRYYFDIYKSKSNLLKFEQEIGFTSPVKAMKLRTIIHQV